MHRLIFTVIFLLHMSAIYGQDILYGFQANAGIPVRELRDNVGNIVFPEYTFIALYSLPYRPIEVGLSIGYGKYGTKLEKRTDLYPGFNDELRLRRNNNLLTLMGVFRFNPEVNWKVEPFIEAQLGANYFYTRYKIRESRFDDPLEEGMDFKAWVMAYRVGGGIKIPFKNREIGFLEFKCLYHDSGPVQFLRRQDTEFRPDQGDGEFVYSPQRSAINMVQPGIGIVLYANY
jgi:hypothetical protein